MSFHIHDIHKAFAGKTVLRGVSLVLPRGKIVCLLGASGCGKSTLLRIVAGLLPADAGRVDVGAGACATVFQEPRLLPWLTVAENLALALPFWQRRTSKRAAIAAALRQVRLPGCEERLPHELSGGMAQRVGIARALLQQPAVLLMDEPFAALDALTRREQQSLLAEVVRERACLFVTHDLDEALAIASQILVLAQGRIVLRADCRAQADNSALRARILAGLRSEMVFWCNDEDKS